MFKAVHRRDLLAALILLIPPLLLFWPVTVGPYTLLPADNLFAFEPWASYREQSGVGLPQNQLLSDLVLENYVWKKFIRESIAAGEIPLWDPYIFSGHPFLANGQHSGLYPFSILFYLLPLSKAYGWFTVSQLWLAGLAMYVFLRVLRANRLAALTAGLVFSMSGFFVFRVVFTMIIAAAAWLPLVLAMIEMVVRKQEEKGLAGYSPIPYIAGGALALGLQALAGHVEMTYYTLLVAGFYAVCRLFILWRRQASFRFVWRLGLWLAAMVVLGLGLAAVQLVPMYEIVTQNFRGDAVTLAQVRGWALPWRRLISFFIPHFFGSSAHHGYFDLLTWRYLPLGLNAHGQINPLCPHCTTWDVKTSVEAGAYAGILPLALAGLAIASAVRTISNLQSPIPQSPNLQSPTLIFAALGLLSLLFAFGTPLYALLFYGLPGWDQLHSPFRWIFPYTLSLAVLAGLGVDLLARQVSAAPGRLADRSGFPYRLSLAAGWMLFWGGLAGTVLMLVALFVPGPFIAAATAVFNRSGLAQNAFASGRQFMGYQWPNLFKFFLMTTAAGAVLRVARCPIFLRRIPAWQWLAPVIITVDLLLSGAGFNPAVNPALLHFEPQVARWLKDRQAGDPYFRITSFDTPEGRGNKVFLANAGMYYNLFDVRGYDSIIPAAYARFMQVIQPNGDLLFNRIGPVYHPGYDALDSALLDLLGVRYVLTTVDIPNPGYRLVYDREIRVYENTDALPRAFLVYQTAPPGDDLALTLRSLNPRQTVILDGETNGLGRDLTPADAGQPAGPAVEITAYSGREVRLSVQVDRPAWLVLADTYFPGWRAYAAPQSPISQSPISNQPSSIVNQQSSIELTIHRADGTFRAVHLQPGRWEIRFRYSPRSFLLGVYGSFLSLAVLLFMAGYWSWGKLYRETETDSPVKRIAKNSVTPMVLALANRLIDFAFALLMLRILQPEGAGRYAFAVAFISMAEIITRYGLGTLATREVAADRSRTNRYLSNVALLRIFLWLAALPLMAVILGLYMAFGGVTTDVLVATAILAVGTLLSNLSDGLTAIFYAHEKAEYPAAIASVTALTRVSVGALVLLLGWGIIGLAGASLVANLVAFITLAYIMTVKIYRPWLEADRSLQREMMAESLPLMLNHLLATIFFRIDVFILKPTWGDNSVGFYNAAYKYIDGINVIPQYFTLAIFPLMSRFAAGSRESLVRAYILSLRLLMLLALPLAVGTPFVARELILFLAGERFLPDSMIVLQILIWFLPFSFINQVTQYVLIAVNQQRHLTRAFIIGVLFNLVTNLIFIPLYGYRAAAVTTILSEWALLIPFYRLVRANLCTVPWLDVVWRPAAAAGVMGAVLWLIGDVNFLLTVLVAGGVYFAVLAAVGGLRQPDMHVVWRAIPVRRLRERLGRGPA